MQFEIRDIWGIFLGIVAFIAWFIRLEQAVKSSERECKRLDITLTSLKIEHASKIDGVKSSAEIKIDNLTNSLNEIRVMLARIEGALGSHSDKE